MTKEERIYLVTSTFLDNPTMTIQEISEKTGISSSSVQRYLNIPTVKAVIIPKLDRTIEEQLKVNMLSGRSKGGRTTFLRYDAIKDENGKYTGLKETTEIDKEEIKRTDIKRIVMVFTANPLFTIEELTNVFNGEYSYSYVYRCLKDSRVEEIFSKETAEAVIHQLDSNRYGLLKKFKEIYGTEIFEKANITDREREIIEYRFSDDCLISAEDTAIHFGISKSAVTSLEDSALEKIETYKEVKQK